MKAIAVIVSALILALASHATAGSVNFYFTTPGDGQAGNTISGKLIGLSVDANGNANHVDPTSILIFQAPSNLGFPPPSPDNPYVLTPFLYATTFHNHPNSIVEIDTPGVYGFNISNYTIVQPLDLAITDGAQVQIAFNFESSILPGQLGVNGVCGPDSPTDECDENQLGFSGASYSLATCAGDVALPHNAIVNVDDFLAVINAWGPCPAPPASCPADISPAGGDGVVNVDDLLAVIDAWGPCP